MPDPDPILAPCRPGFRRAGGTVRAGRRVVATWHPEERRIAWDWAAVGADPELIARAGAESAEFDAWAEAQAAEIAAIPPRGGADYSLAGWRRWRPALGAAEAAGGVGIDLAGKRILEIGGSGRHMVYWLAEGPARIDQVEVSAGSQRLALARLRKVHGAEAGRHPPVLFHTVPAEALPFADAGFDVVFSGATLHHCRRPAVFDEALRVLAPGGVLVFTDRYLSAPLHLAMRARRWALGMARGTDDPIRPSELRRLAARMERAWWGAIGGRATLAYLAAKLPGWLGRLARGPIAQAPPAAFSPYTGSALDRWLGQTVVFIGRTGGVP